MDPSKQSDQSNLESGYTRELDAVIEKFKSGMPLYGLVDHLRDLMGDLSKCAEIIVLIYELDESINWGRPLSPQRRDEVKTWAEQAVDFISRGGKNEILQVIALLAIFQSSARAQTYGTTVSVQDGEVARLGPYDEDLLTFALVSPSRAHEIQIRASVLKIGMSGLFEVMRAITDLLIRRGRSELHLYDSKVRSFEMVLSQDFVGENPYRELVRLAVVSLSLLRDHTSMVGYVEREEDILSYVSRINETGLYERVELGPTDVHDIFTQFISIDEPRGAVHMNEQYESPHLRGIKFAGKVPVKYDKDQLKDTAGWFGPVSARLDITEAVKTIEAGSRPELKRHSNYPKFCISYKHAHYDKISRISTAQVDRLWSVLQVLNLGPVLLWWDRVYSFDTYHSNSIKWSPETLTNFNENPVIFLESSPSRDSSSLWLWAERTAALMGKGVIGLAKAIYLSNDHIGEVTFSDLGFGNLAQGISAAEMNVKGLTAVKAAILRSNLSHKSGSNASDFRKLCEWASDAANSSMYGSIGLTLASIKGFIGRKKCLNKEICAATNLVRCGVVSEDLDDKDEVVINSYSKGTAFAASNANTSDGKVEPDSICLAENGGTLHVMLGFDVHPGVTGEVKAALRKTEGGLHTIYARQILGRDGSVSCSIAKTNWGNMWALNSKESGDPGEG